MASWIPTDNISFQAIPLAWVIALSPRLYARYLYRSSMNKDMDIAHPRNFAKDVTADSTLDTRTRGRIVRAEAAMQNGFENIALFAAAVVAGNVAGLDVKLLNALSLAYCLSRVAFNFAYVNAETSSQAYGRVVAFFMGIGCCLHLFVKAGEKFKQSAL